MSEPARRYLRWLTPAALGLYALACLVLWAARDWRPEWDGAVYVLVGKSLAAGEGYLYQGEPFFLRPPGLPWMLSFLVGGEGFDPYPVNLLLMGFAAAAVGAVWFALRQVHGGGLPLAVALLTGTSLLFGQAFNSVFAEFPFMAFAFLGMALLERSRRGARDLEGGETRAAPWWIPALVGGACLAVAVTMRTVAVLVLPGVFLLPLLTERGKARWRGALPLVVAVLLTAPWFRYSRAAAADAEVPVEQDLLYDYTTALFHVDPGDPASPLVDLDGWIERVRANSAALLGDLSEATLHMPGGALPGVLLLAVLAAGVALELRRRGPSLLEWLGLVYVPLVATYFVYDTRLVLPLVPLVYLYLASAVRAAAGRLSPGRATPVTLLATALLLTANVVFLSRDLAGRTHSGANRADMARGVLQHTPEDARILCNQAPIMALLTGRRTFTYRFRRSPDMLTKYGIDFVLYDTPDTPPPLKQLVAERRVRAWPIPFGDGLQTRLIQVR